ncbi:type I-C CRISPR-associated protein Cas7/Csd2 [Candidatus Endoriftia persephone]|jgi:CRISPR-associated protein Csd2|uniref:CRISPR-associated protein, Csd2 family n=2 Tax=Gammaproteobacteria TaxID=1236 RepID=G2DHA9_9GAMM|nr:type I-C CRISPR-associated protein Cas7/Csd2 [Candidatus Endoriftia persephone]EGV49996.1 CRISPR-associated protein, Csd2 family [endosymbiont of Riftia pachyptila (vent Ph05)]USF86473.1 type I-C CRISPR-associated protein Cas7/Csd2 [Candidatus Endoriftia persephone]
MSSLTKKIDFAVIFTVKNANPNGDPLNGNRPRTDYEGYGEITDVCLKRKIRDRLQSDGQAIFVQSDEKKTDGMPSLKARAESDEHGLGKDSFNVKKTTPDETARRACEKWLDVRTFGQLFAFKSDAKDGVSIPIRGPVSIQSAFSVEPVSITSTQITKSVSGEGDGSKKSSDTMGMKHRVDSATYVVYGSMNPQLAERTGFSTEDAEAIKTVLPRLFEGDASSARPEGSMAVEKLIWWQHNCKSGQYSSAKVHRTLQVNSDASYQLTNLEGLVPEEIDGF